MPTLDVITIFPIKALDGQTVERARLLPSGALEDDRRYALVDAEGRYFNGKRTPRLHAVRSAVDLEHLRLELVYHEELATFHLQEDREEIERWFSEFLGERVRLIEDRAHGFPDDTDAPGPTVISTSTLQTIASWFPALSLAEVRRRFRANLEIGGVEPFWEDRLYAEAGAEVPFSIGNVRLAGVNPCQRCAVPTRDSHTGEPIPDFVKRFAARREAELPLWAIRERFNHFYRLAVNTKPPQNFSGGVITCGDLVAIGDP